MTTHDDDPHAPPVTGDDAGDAAWLLARDRGEPPPPVRADAAPQYGALEDLLGTLEPIAPPDGWQAGVLAQVDALEAADAAGVAGAAAPPLTEVVPPRPPAGLAPIGSRSAERAKGVKTGGAPDRRRMLALAGAGVAIAAALVLVLRPRGAATGPALRVTIVSADGKRGGEVAPVGSGIEIVARLAGAGALRLYFNDGLLAACPGSAGCQQRQAGARVVYTLTLPLDQVGRYRPVLFDGPVPDSTGSLDADHRAATQAGVRIEERTPVAYIDVR